MQKEFAHIQRMSTPGDAAVTGLLDGLLGGAAMAVVIAGWSLLGGQGLLYLGGFSSAGAVSPLQGLLLHLGVSSIYGILFGLLTRWVGADRLKRLPGWLWGLVYALALWVFAITLLLPASNSPMLALPWPVFFSGHVAYGLVLGARQLFENSGDK